MYVIVLVSIDNFTVCELIQRFFYKSNLNNIISFTYEVK